MDKYYTPEMEEFCIGFEYDEKYIANTDNPEWISKVATYHRDGKYNVNEGCIEDISRDDDNGWVEYRVKYLDKTNIESLGLTYDAENSFGKDYPTFNIGIYIMYSSMNSHRISLLYIHNGMEFYVFDGIIKNKSELAKLLKQLNITK